MLSWCVSVCRKPPIPMTPPRNQCDPIFALHTSPPLFQPQFIICTLDKCWCLWVQPMVGLAPPAQGARLTQLSARGAAGAMRSLYLIQTRRWPVLLSSGLQPAPCPPPSRGIKLSAAAADLEGTSASEVPELVQWVQQQGGRVDGATYVNLAGRDGGSGFGLKATRVSALVDCRASRSTALHLKVQRVSFAPHIVGLWKHVIAFCRCSELKCTAAFTSLGLRRLTVLARMDARMFATTWLCSWTANSSPNATREA